jgi:hypothetical protein
VHTISTRWRSEHHTPSFDQPVEDRREVRVRDRGEDVHARDRHCQKRDVGSGRGVVWEADAWSEQAGAVVEGSGGRHVRAASRARCR